MTPELLIVIVASGSCVAICLAILLLVVFFYSKDLLCCRFKQEGAENYSDEAHHYHSRHSLINISHEEPGAAGTQGPAGEQIPGRMFVIGKPNDYHLNGGLPRLPSYESVRKKDRQRQIHSMISERFGLGGCHDEPPPTYEETLRQSLDLSPSHLPSLEVHLSVQIQEGSSAPLSENTQSPPPRPAEISPVLQFEAPGAPC